MVAALPHCDALVSGHSFEALGEVVDAIARRGEPRRRRPAPGRREAEEEPWASATPVPGSSVAMPSGYGPSRGNTTPGWGDGDDDEPRRCIYPGCERPAVPPHPLGGPQPAFCDLEEHNALTAHQERQRLASRPTTGGDASVADEAYRAVFLRVHPTGKMVLSLTTESDGREAEYARLVADELGVPALDVKVVPADTDRFGVGHGFNTSPVRRAPRRRSSARRRRSATRRGCWPGMALDAPPETLEWSNGAWSGAARPGQVKTIEDVALYAHGTGALPPGVEGGLDAQTVYRD